MARRRAKRFRRGQIGLAEITSEGRRGRRLGRIGRVIVLFLDSGLQEISDGVRGRVYRRRSAKQNRVSGMRVRILV